MTWWALVIANLWPIGSATPDACSAPLVQLDRARAVAFAEADPDLLDRVYVPGSPLRAADAEAIESYRQRGGRVLGAALVIGECRVLRRGDGRLRLEVVDRLRPSIVRWDDGSMSVLPRDNDTRRTVELVRTDGGWRVGASVDRGAQG